MVAAQVMGHHVTVMTAAAQSFPELHDLDVLRPVIMHNALQSCQVLANAAQGFAVRMVGILEPNREHIADTVAKSLMLVTALSPHIGYDKIVRIGKLALSDNITLKQAERPG